MKLRSLVFLGLVSGLALTACGDDDDGGGSGGSGGGGTGGSGTGGASTGGMGGMAGMGAMGGMAGMGTGGMAGMATGGAAGSGTGGSGTGGAGTGGASTGGTGGGSGNMTPDAFCASYETHCGFGATDHYASSADCKTKYTAMGPVQQKCTNDHLAMADSKTSIHCTHATGIAPCNQTN